MEGAAYLLSFFGYSRMKCKVGDNAILGLSKGEMARNACFYIELVSVTYGAIREHIIGIVMISERDFDNVTCVRSYNVYAL